MAEPFFTKDSIVLRRGTPEIACKLAITSGRTIVVAGKGASVPDEWRPFIPLIRSYAHHNKMDVRERSRCPEVFDGLNLRDCLILCIDKVALNMVRGLGIMAIHPRMGRGSVVGDKNYDTRVYGEDVVLIGFEAKRPGRNAGDPIPAPTPDRVGLRWNGEKYEFFEPELRFRMAAGASQEVRAVPLWDE